MNQSWANRYLNRELSLLAFHCRVLAMAEDDSLPLLERLQFLCISSSNLDEFFEVRVAALKQKRAHGLKTTGVDEAEIFPLLQQIREQVADMVRGQYTLLNHDLIPALASEGVRFLCRDQWNKDQRVWLKRYMRQHRIPVISPLGIDPAHPFPKIANKYLHFILSLEGKDAFVEGFFPSMKVTGCYPFRLTRDKLYLDEEELTGLGRASPLKQRVIREGLRYYLKDSESAWRLKNDGSYVRVHPRTGPAGFNAQETLLEDLDVVAND